MTLITREIVCGDCQMAIEHPALIRLGTAWVRVTDEVNRSSYVPVAIHLCAEC